MKLLVKSGSVLLLLLALLLVFGEFGRQLLVRPSSGLRAEAVGEGKICGYSHPAPLKYDHVIWILEENKGLEEVINTPHAPYLSGLAAQCSYSVNFLDNEPDENLGQGFHSLSHYLANVSGSNCVIGNGRNGEGCIYLDDRYPGGYSLPTASLFQQVQEAGMSWKSYQESSPRNCSLDSNGLYAPKHDAAVYFTQIREACLQNDVPIPALSSQPKGALIEDIKNDRLPSFAYITPDVVNDMHDGSVAQGDRWLKAYLEPILRSKTYAEGRTAIFIVWDEATTAQQTLPNLFIAPTAKGGATAVPMNGFAVLKATESMLALPPLGCAAGEVPGGTGDCYTGATTDIRSLFNF